MHLPEMDLDGVIQPITCPACAHHVAVPFYDGGEQPLATLGWPASAEDARAMARLPLRFVRCVDCGHVYNAAFEYASVPYADNPNLMYNRSPIWKEHLDRVCTLLSELLRGRGNSPCVVEIGCGEGHLLRALAERGPRGRYVGFDPNARIDTGGGRIQARAELFTARKHVQELRPDVIISRHVLEHLMNPLGFVQGLSFAADWAGIETSLFIEVPCIDRLFESGRFADLYYEHNSHFTSTSFERFLKRCAPKVGMIEKGYGGEVIYGVAELHGRAERVRHAREAMEFAESTRRARHDLAAQLRAIHARGDTVALWGGTGKSAAFLNALGVEDQVITVVVDSDPQKVGTYVPGRGLRIESPDVLLSRPVDVVLIATQWRARDIAAEIARRGISAGRLVIEHRGTLLDLQRDPNPYWPRAKLDVAA